MYSEIAANKRKTVIIMAVFVLLVAATDRLSAFLRRVLA